MKGLSLLETETVVQLVVPLPLENYLPTPMACILSEVNQEDAKRSS